MAQDEYNKVELPAITQLKQLGWIYIHGDELSPEHRNKERNSFKDVVLEKRLRSGIKRINSWISDENLNKVISELIRIQTTTLQEANQSIYETLIHHLSVTQDLGKGNKGQTVKIIDFDNVDNNEFIATNQFKVSGVHQNIIPDIILFVNGLPLTVIECKSPYITNPMEAGIYQLLRYANRRHPEENEGAEKLFWYNQMMISTHRDRARIGTISSRMEHYLEWKDPYPIKHTDIKPEPNSQEVMFAGIFTKIHFLDLIQNFIVFEPVDGKVIKKIARYQQFRAVHKSIERIKTGKTQKDKGGVIWHTQGSGKSLTMVFLAVKMRRDPILKEYKLVFITDRIQLDGQLTSTFENTQGETVYHAKSVSKLKELLQNDSSDLVTAMIQKFQESDTDFDFPELNSSEKIIVLADEAHRSQYGILGVALNTALPNAPKIAFTGTPLMEKEKDKAGKTTNEFGTYIDTYTIEQAVEDGSTVQILYEGREAQTKVTGDSLDKLFNEYFGDKTEEEQNTIKKKYGTEKAVLEAPQRIRWVCIDILKHYREHIQPNGFKAMIVTSSRHSATIYKQMLDELDAPESRVIISGDHNDPEYLRQYTDSKNQKQYIKNFTKPLRESPMSILIVKDMLLTGFDAPVCQVMYLDRKITDHNLLQAIARVNRTHEGKQCGFIVDYYGLSDYLTEALDMFTSADIKGALKNLKDELPKLQACHTRVMRYFKDVNREDIDACVLVLKDAEIRQQFEIDFKKFAKQMDIIFPDVSTKPYIPDLMFLGKVNQSARNMYRDSQLNIAGVGEKVRKLIDEHIIATGVDPKIPPIDLLANNFKDHVSGIKSDKAKASEIEHAIKSHITVNIENDPAYYKSLSERLEGIIQEHGEHWDELVQFLFNFRENIETDRKKGAVDLGLTETEFAFRNILVSELSRITENDAIDENVHDEILKVTTKLVEMIESSQLVDFFDKHDEVKKVQLSIKRALMETSFGDDEKLRSAVINSFMDLAKVKFGK
jgi:type I restriction enzyme R subunit